MLPESSTDPLFRPLLDKELLRITNFYESQERELFEELEALEEQIVKKESQGLRPDGAYAHEEEDDDEDLLSGSGELSRSRSREVSRDTGKSPLGGALFGHHGLKCN